MARRNPSFLKRQKEQNRIERANAKRAERQARRKARTDEAAPEMADEEISASETQEEE